MASGHFFTILKLDELTVTNPRWPKVGVFVEILMRLEAVPSAGIVCSEPKLGPNQFLPNAVIQIDTVHGRNCALKARA